MRGYVTQFEHVEAEEPRRVDGKPSAGPEKRAVEVFYDLPGGRIAAADQPSRAILSESQSPNPGRMPVATRAFGLSRLRPCRSQTVRPRQTGVQSTSTWHSVSDSISGSITCATATASWTGLPA
jgi:hypothetical protein